MDPQFCEQQLSSGRIAMFTNKEKAGSALPCISGNCRSCFTYSAYSYYPYYPAVSFDDRSLQDRETDLSDCIRQQKIQEVWLRLQRLRSIRWNEGASVLFRIVVSDPLEGRSAVSVQDPSSEENCRHTGAAG